MIYYEDIGNTVTHRKISTNTQIPAKRDWRRLWLTLFPLQELLLSHISRLLCGRSFLCRSSFSFCRSLSLGLCLALLGFPFRSCWLGRVLSLFSGLLLGGLNLWVFPGDAKELLKLIVLVGNVKSIIIPTIFLPVEYLGRQHVPLSLLLCCIRSHEVSLLLHAWSRDVAKLDGDAQAFQDHGDSVLRVLDLLVPAVPTDEDLDGVLGDGWGWSWGLCLTHLSCRSESSNKSLVVL